jgi:hypothetical protein
MSSGREPLSRSRRWAGWSAIGATTLFMAANFLWAFEMPAPDAPGPELVDYYTDLSDRIAAGGLLSLLSIAIFVVFAAALRSVLAEQGDALLGDVAFGGAVLGLTAGVGAESTNAAAAIRAGNDDLTEPVAQSLFDISYVLGSYAAGIGLGVLMLAIGVAALRNRALLPRWLALAAVAVGLATVTPLFGFLLGEYTVGPSYLLLLALGVLLLRGARA